MSWCPRLIVKSWLYIYIYIYIFDVLWVFCCQTGAWGCFDEFNRINIEVLSVVAQQILLILSALAANQVRFVFEGREINLIWSCGMFITMNPGKYIINKLQRSMKAMFALLYCQLIYVWLWFYICCVYAERIQQEKSS